VITSVLVHPSFVCFACVYGPFVFVRSIQKSFGDLLTHGSGHFGVYIFDLAFCQRQRIAILGEAKSA
jgi:hypothetical protein